MSETLCTLRTKGGGGGKYTETSLWTNPSPSSNFASQTITLSDSMTNYDYLKVTYINATGSSVSNIDIVPVSAFITTGTQTIRSALGAVGTTGGSTRDFARNYKYAADNQINFGTACALNYAAAENNRIIPLEILGLNELDHGKKMDDTILWTNASPTSSFSAQTITLSEDMTVYDYIKIVYEYSNSATTILCQVLIPMSDFVTYKADSSRSGVGNLGVFNSTNNSAARSFWYVSATKVGFGAAYLLAQTSANNTVCIPVNIIGCKLS